MRNGPIGQYLLEKNLLTEEELNAVLERQKTEKDKKFGDLVVEMKLVSDVDFAKTLAERMNIEFIDLDNTVLNADVVRLIPEAKSRASGVIAVRKIGRRLMVATSDPMNLYIFEDLRMVTGCNITPQLATKGAINRAIGKMYSEGTAAKVAEEAKQQKEEETIDLNDIDLSSDTVDNAPIVKLATAIVEQAYRQGATDIHIEPFKDNTKIRVRINSDLVPLMDDLDARIHAGIK